VIHLWKRTGYGIPKNGKKVKDMPITINGQKYYRTTEVCRIVGISRNTLFRWLKEGNVTEVEHRDYRGWRLFTQVQVDAMKEKIRQVSTIPIRNWAKEAGSTVPSKAGSITEHPGARSSHED
jgi:phage antirepressor YoqD-like protein